MLVEQQGDEEGDIDENVEEVNDGDAAEGDHSVAHREVPTITEEPSIPSPTPPPQPPQDIPSISQKVEREGAETREEEQSESVEAQKGRMIAEMDHDDAIILEDDKEEDREVADAVKEAKEDETEPAKVQEVVDVVTTVKLITEVVTAASETITTASAIITTAEAQVPAATTTTLTVALARVTAAPTIDHVKRKAKEDPAMKRCQVLKRKPQTKAQARNNMMMYLKNVVGFKIDYFKGMSYDDIRPIFEAKFNSNVAFLLKIKQQIAEDENKVLQKINETPAERAAKRRKLDEENERSVHGQAKVKSWKLLESCGVQIITFTTTQLILLVERRYPLSRFTLDQMLNTVRFQVEEESEVPLELLRFTRQQHQEGQLE
nr:hypothetical protein [Tanacetum cinerariifolium]